MQIKLSVHFVALCLLFIGGTSANAAAGTATLNASASAVSEAEQFVQRGIDTGFAILKNNELDASKRQSQFRGFLFSIVDTRRVALFTLGPYARAASDAELDEFLTAYNNFVAALYQGYFDWYKGEDLRVARSTARSQDDVIVFADILGPKGDRRFTVGFRVRHDHAGKNIVTDLQFEGSWIALNQRADFTSYLQRNGGNFATLSTELQKRTQRFKEEWAPPTK